MEFEELLSIAIIQQAAADYRKARMKLEKLEKKQILTEKESKQKMYCIKEITQVRTFFNSAWFEILSELDGASLFLRLEREYNAEKRINRNWK